MSKARPHYIIRTFLLLRRNLGSFLRFELGYKLVSILIFFPLMERLETLALRLAGVYYLSNYNLARVLRNPVVWIMVVLSILLIGLFISVELLGLAAGAHASYYKVKITATDMLGEAVGQIWRLIRQKKPGNILLIFYSFLLVPLVDIYDTVTIIQNFSFFGYFAERISRKLRYEIIAGSIGVFLVVLFFTTILTIPILVCKKTSFLEAAGESIKTIRIQIFRPIFAIIAWLILGVALVGGLVVGLLVGARLVVQWLDPEVNPAIMMSNEALLVVEIVATLFVVLIISPVVMARLSLGYYFRFTNPRTPGKKKEEKQEILAPEFMALDLQELEDIPEAPQIPEFVPVERHIRNRWWAMLIVWSIIILLGYFTIPPKYQQVKQALAGGNRGVMIMAHRGDSVSAPENTLPAFQNAIDHGADAAELDVQMTKDGVIVCMHDSSLKRTTGVKKHIWEVTYDEIKDLDNGSFYSPSYRFTRIPTLDQVMKLTKGKLYLNIEIKRTGHDEGIVEKTLEIIAANHYENDCDITSFDYNTLKQIKALNKDIYTVYTTTVGGGDISKLKAANAFSIEENFVTAQMVRYLRKENKGIYVWTVNTERDINRMIDLNVDAIITDNVSLGVNLLETNQGLIGILSRIRRLILSL